MILYEVPLSDAFELMGLLDDRHKAVSDASARAHGNDLRGFHERMKRRSRGH